MGRASAEGEFPHTASASNPPQLHSLQTTTLYTNMGVPRIIRRVEAAKKDEKRSTTRVAPSIAKPKKKRSDKLRALAGAFGAEASEGSASPTEGLAAKYDVYEKVGQGKQGVMVFRCTERSTGKPYAVKRVPKTLLGTTHGDERPMVAALRGCTQL